MERLKNDWSAALDAVWHEMRFSDGVMETGLLPKKFEIHFRLAEDDTYTGVLVVDGRQMGVGTPKSLEEITAFLMPHLRLLPSSNEDRTVLDQAQART